MLAKLLPLTIAVVGVTKNSDKIKRMVEQFKTPAIQAEMSNICKVIHLDSIDGTVPDTDAEAFANYIRKNIIAQKNDVKRDFAKDFWGTGYRLELKNRVATVVSAGPDKSFDSKDDIRASTDLF